MNFKEQEINRTWKAAEKIDLYRQMMRIRSFERNALKHYNAGNMGGFLTLSIGQECVAATVRSLMRPQDHSITGPRGIGHAIVAGLEMGACMAELYGKANGCSAGKGGVFSMFAPSRHHWGSYATVASQTPLAAGLAFALKQRDIPGVVFCFLGDGAVNQGVFHESLNLAGLFGLPVIYVIENNGYAMGTSVSRASAFKHSLAHRAEGYGIDWDALSGSDPYEIRARTQPAIERARDHQRPSVLEISTYRYYGFTVADSMTKKYRTPQDIIAHQERDPLTMWSQYLLREGFLDQDEMDGIAWQTKREAKAAVDFAELGTGPTIADVGKNVYWESDNATDASKIGRHFFND